MVGLGFDFRGGRSNDLVVRNDFEDDITNNAGSHIFFYVSLCITSIDLHKFKGYPICCCVRLFSWPISLHLDWLLAYPYN